MKKIIFFSMLTYTLVFIGCSKENEDFTPYLKGKMNGAPFNGTLYLSAYPNSGAGIIMSGVYEYGSIVMVIDPFNNKTGERVVNENNSIIIWYSGGDYYAGSANPGSPSQGCGKINISMVTGQYIQGTFECVAPIGPLSGSGTSLTITEGEFKLKRS